MNGNHKNVPQRPSMWELHSSDRQTGSNIRNPIRPQPNPLSYWRRQQQQLIRSQPFYNSGQLPYHVPRFTMQNQPRFQPSSIAYHRRPSGFTIQSPPSYEQHTQPPIRYNSTMAIRISSQIPMGSQLPAPHHFWQGQPTMNAKLNELMVQGIPAVPNSVDNAQVQSVPWRKPSIYCRKTVSRNSLASSTSSDTNYSEESICGDIGNRQVSIPTVILTENKRPTAAAKAKRPKFAKPFGCDNCSERFSAAVVLKLHRDLRNCEPMIKLSRPPTNIPDEDKQVLLPTKELSTTAFPTESDGAPTTTVTNSDWRDAQLIMASISTVVDGDTDTETEITQINSCDEPGGKMNGQRAGASCRKRYRRPQTVVSDNIVALI